MLLIGLGIVRIVGDVVAGGLELLDRSLELGDRCADVRQLDDVGVGLLGQLAEFGKVVGNALFGGEAIGEVGEDAPGERDVGRLDDDPGGSRVRLDDRQEGERGQRGCFVGPGVDDLRGIAHVRAQPRCSR